MSDKYIDEGGAVRSRSERRGKAGLVLLMCRRLSIGDSFSYLSNEHGGAAHNAASFLRRTDSEDFRITVKRKVLSVGAGIILVTRIS